MYILERTEEKKLLVCKDTVVRPFIWRVDSPVVSVPTNWYQWNWFSRKTIPSKLILLNVVYSFVNFMTFVFFYRFAWMYAVRRDIRREFYSKILKINQIIVGMRTRRRKNSNTSFLKRVLSFLQNKKEINLWNSFSKIYFWRRLSFRDKDIPIPSQYFHCSLTYTFGRFNYSTRMTIIVNNIVEICSY